jgi:two-component system NarL family sensor kinase
LTGQARARKIPVIRTAERPFVIFQAVTLAGCIAVAAAIRDEQAWPVGLLVALVALACSGVAGVRTDAAFRVNNASIAVILAAVLTGASGAVLVAIAVMTYDAVVSRLSARDKLTNFWAFGVWALLIGLAVAAVVDPGASPTDELALAALLALVVGDLVNFGLIALEVQISAGVSIARSCREVLMPVLPWMLVGSALTAGLVLAYEAMGTAAIWGAVVLVLAQTLLLQTIFRSRDRGSELDAVRAEAQQRAHEIDALAADRARLVDLMLGAEEAERERLAELLHDSVLQELVVAQQALAEGDGERDRLERAVRTATEQLRASLQHLHPLMHEQIGLKPALEAVGEYFPRLHGLTIDVDPAADDGRVDNRLLFWLARELLINALKHSRANVVSVSVRCNDAQLALRVEDDGVGLRTADAGAERGHLGLALCMRRVRDAGGRLTITVPPQGGGARVDVVLPIRPLPSLTGSRAEASSSPQSPATA